MAGGPILLCSFLSSWRFPRRPCGAPGRFGTLELRGKDTEGGSGEPCREERLTASDAFWSGNCYSVWGGANRYVLYSLGGVECASREGG